MLRRIQWPGKGLKIKGRAGLIDESRPQGRKERPVSTAPHRNRDSSSAEPGRKEIRTGMLRAARGCAVVSGSSWLKASLPSCSWRLEGRAEGLKLAQPLTLQSKALALTTGYDKEVQFPLRSQFLFLSPPGSPSL